MVRMVKYDEDAYVPEECCTMTNPQTSCGTSVPDDVCMPCEGGDLCDGDCSGCVIQKIMNEYAKSAQEHDQLAEWLEELKQYRTIGTPEECRAAVAVKKEVQDIVDRLEELKEEKTIGSHKVIIKEAIEIVRGEADA